MRKLFFLTGVILSCILWLYILSCTKKKGEDDPVIPPPPALTLREQYSLSPDKWSKAQVADGVEFWELGMLPGSPFTATTGKELLELGRTLFFDARLSGAGGTGCHNCHKPASYWQDDLNVGGGVALGVRNTPTLGDVWSLKFLFWDGRATTFEEQITEAITSPIEMNQDMDMLPQKLASVSTYLSMFQKAFGDNKVTKSRILEALAAYTKTIESGKSDFDFFLEGDKTKLTDEQIEGLHLFRTKAGCINCHNGPLFTDNKFHNLGYAVNRVGEADSGYYITTKNLLDVGKFKTPGLRNVAKTSPYFHNGAINSLERMIDLLNEGMPQQTGQRIIGELSPLIKPLNLTAEEKKALIAFLQSLTGPMPNG